MSISFDDNHSTTNIPLMTLMIAYVGAQQVFLSYQGHPILENKFNLSEMISVFVF